MATPSRLSTRGACALFVMLTALSCADEPASLVSEIKAGLHLLDAAAVSFDGHLVELVAHEGYAYVANSRGLASLRLEADGTLTLTDDGKTAAGLQTSCTALALHAPSNTLYCSADRPSFGEPRIEVYSLDDPAHPVRVDPLWLDAWAVRDIEVVDDTLLINQFDDGLWTARIADDGALSPAQRTVVEGNVRFTVPAGEYLVSALLDAEELGMQLRLLQRETFIELDRLELDGPPISLSSAPEGVAAALGSRGVALVDVVDGTLVERLRLRPEAVSTHALVAGDLAFAVTLSGTFAYDLSGPQPRPFGFAVESGGAHERNGNMLHAQLYEGELLTSDWTHVERWAVDPRGEVVSLDVPRGIYVRPEDPVEWRMRNPSALPLRVEFWVRRSFVFSVTLAPGAVETVSLSAQQHARLMPSDSPELRLKLRVFDPVVDSTGEALSTTYLTILDRDESGPPAAVGERFPAIAFGDAQQQMFALPQPRALRLVWNTTACALMWPEFEDLAWAQRSGQLEAYASGEPVLLAPDDATLGFARRWGLEQLEWGLFGPDAPDAINALNVDYGGEDLMATFIVTDLPGDSDTSDYVLDAQGIVRSIERMYRGPHTLAIADPSN